MKQVSSTELIEYLDFKKRTFHLLRRGGIYTVFDLLNALKKGKIEQIKGIGPKSYQEVRKVIKNLQIVEPEVVHEAFSQIDVSAGDANEDNSIQKKLGILSNAIDEMIAWQEQMILKQIKIGLLHEKVRIAGNSLEQWLKLEKHNQYLISKIYTKTLTATCITEELAFLTRECSFRDINILIARYGLLQKTYEQLGNEVGVTRERIRQILKRIEQRISGKVRNTLRKENIYGTELALIRIQSALLFGKQRGLDITYNEWSQSLKVSGLLGNWEIGRGFACDPIELLLSICNLLDQEGVEGLSLPNNLRYATYLAAEDLPTTPAKSLQIIKNLPKKIQKEIRRHTRFSGGAQARWLSREINYETKHTEGILLALGYTHVKGDWYIPGKVEMQKELSRFDVLEHSLRKMSQYCGPLSVENLCGGIRHAVSRTRYPVPSPDVMKEILNSRGYMYVLKDFGHNIMETFRLTS